MSEVEADVLVVGTGPAGGAAALLLAGYGVDTIAVTRYGRLSDTPRAHITNQRTMEVLRDAGVEDTVLAQATPQHLMGDTPFCTSLAGEELGRLRTWYTHPNRQAGHDLASPTSICDDELFHHATTWPGAKVPHAWVTRGRERLSTLDLGGHGRFTLLTGVGGESWVAAAASVGRALGGGADHGKDRTGSRLRRRLRRLGRPARDR